MLNDTQKNYAAGLYHRYQRRFPDKSHEAAKNYAIKSFKSMVQKMADTTLSAQIEKDLSKYLDELATTK